MFVVFFVVVFFFPLVWVKLNYIYKLGTKFTEVNNTD